MSYKNTYFAGSTSTVITNGNRQDTYILGKSDNNSSITERGISKNKEEFSVEQNINGKINRYTKPFQPRILWGKAPSSFKRIYI
jgi:hypothetical protein